MAKKQEKDIEQSTAEQRATQQKIVEAAKRVFHKRGFDGARMQEIADEAGINKAMLHYYFRSKDQLFEAIFKMAAEKIFLPMKDLLMSEASLEEKIEHFVRHYMDALIANPMLPSFVVHEMNTNPERLVRVLPVDRVKVPGIIAAQIRQGIKEGRYREVQPLQFIVSMVGMCVFPFIARPILQLRFEFSDKEFAKFLEERKKTLASFIINALHTS